MADLDKQVGRAVGRFPLRSVLAGSAGTLALTLAYATERRVRRGHRGQLDYDDSLVPGQIVASIMHLPHVTDREENELGLALRWGYGSAFGIWHGILHRRFSEPLASIMFGATLMSATLTLFPASGPNAAAVALAEGRDGDQSRDACRLRRGGRDRRRQDRAARALTERHRSAVSKPVTRSG